MAYIGYNPSQLAVAPFATKLFTGDGTTTTFTLDQSVPGANEANVEVVVENVLQNPIDAYTIGGALNNQLIFSEAPVSGAVIYVIHKGEATYNLQPSTGSVTASTLDPVLRNFTVNSFTGTGSAATFTLTDTPYSANSILVTVDGITQTAGVNYTVSGTTLDFGATAPDNGSVITVVHLGFSSGNKSVMDGSISPVKLSTGGPSWNTSGTMFIGTSTALGGATNPIVAMYASANNYVQTYVLNRSTGTGASADLVAYPDNGTDSSGWIDMGITSSTFSSTPYGITGANEGYLFMSAPAGASKSGNMVLATDSTGTSNAIVFATGGFTAGTERMRITGAGNIGINNNNPQYALDVNSAQIVQRSSSSLGTRTSFISTAANGRNWQIGSNFVIGNGEFSIYDATASAEKFRIEANGIINIPYGQIKFPATQNASSDPNTLDDYEEGNWTPDWKINTVSTGTWAAKVGRYTKVGNMVTVWAYLYTTSGRGSGSGNVIIAGLPFLSVNSLLTNYHVMDARGGVVWSSGGAGLPFWYQPANNTYLIAYSTANSTAATTQQMAEANFSASGAIEINIMMTYETN